MKKIGPIVMILVMAMLAFVLSGCANMMPKPKPAPEKIVVAPTYGELVSIPKAAPTNLKPLQFQIKKVQVASSENPNTFDTIVLYSLDEMNMQVLTGNLDDLQRYIREQKAVIEYLTGLINLRRETTEKEQAK
jgi:hypothetical protein